MVSGKIEFTIRPAVADQAWEIAQLHARVWGQTFAGLAPTEAVEKLDAAHRLVAWDEALSNPQPTRHILVATRNDKIIGFVRFGPAAHPIFKNSCEIKHLYVDSGCKRQGIGRQLLAAAFALIKQDGYKSVGLAVTRGNDNAIGFYQALGGVEVGHFTDLGPIWKSDNLLMMWDDLNFHFMQ